MLLAKTLVTQLHSKHHVLEKSKFPVTSPLTIWNDFLLIEETSYFSCRMDSSGSAAESSSSSEAKDIPANIEAAILRARTESEGSDK